MALNQRVGEPYGDIYFVNTPAIDKQVAQLHAEQQRKLAMQDKAIQDLDNEFAKNMYNIRDADAPDVAKAYGDYKLAAKNLIRKKGDATPEEQYKALQAKANVYGLINKSKTQREQEKLYAGDITKKPNKYIKDAHGKLISVMNTPVSKIGDSNPFDGIEYKGNMSNYSKLLGDAAGKEKKLDDEVVDNPSQLRKDVTHVSRLNNAKEYYDKLISGVVGSQGADDFVRTFDVPESQYQAIKQQYEQKLADPVMRKRLGLETIDLPPDENLTEVQKAAKFLAMQHQVMTNPIIRQGTPIVNNVEVMDKKRKEGMVDKKAMADYNDKLIKGRMKLNQSYKMAFKEFTAGVDAATDESVLNKFIGNMYDNASTQNTASIGGKEYKGRAVDLPKDIKDKYIFSSGNTDEAIPDRWLLTDDKKTLIPLFYGEKTSTGGYKLKTNPNSKPIDIQNFKVDLGKILLTQKQRGGEVIDQFDVPEVQPQKQGNKPAKTKSVTVTSSKQTIPNF